MYFKFRLDEPAVAFVEVRKELNDTNYIELDYHYFSQYLKLLIGKLDYLEVTKATEESAKHKKHLWLSVNGDGKVYLSRVKPIRTSEKFNYPKDTALKVPVEFLDYAGVDLHPLDEPVLFTY